MVQNQPLTQDDRTKDILLQVEDLHVVFETFHGLVRALSAVNLDLHKGKITGLVGETGCGKSVMAKSILRLLPRPGRIENGRILFNNENLLDKSEAQMQNIRGKIIAMIFQNPRSALNPLFTLQDQFYFLLKRHQKLSRKKATDKAVHLLDTVGIPDPKRRIKNYPYELSTGMCQRAMIAMGLACVPQLLIADEPTTGLDVTIQAQVLQLFSDLVYEFDSTALIISHDLGVIAETCDYVAVMYAGNIVEFGRTEDIFERTTHPYTRGLLASSFMDREAGKIHYIPGTVPDLILLPPGCTFAPRCQEAKDICHKERPPTKVLMGDHKVRCF